MTALVIIEYQQQRINAASLCAITAALQLSPSVKALIFGEHGNAIAESVRTIEGVDEVLLASHSVYNDLLAEPCAACIVSLTQQLQQLPLTHIVAAATSAGKNLLPRVAALLNVAQISDITAVLAADSFQRPIYAGNAVATVKSVDAIKVVTIRATAFAAAVLGQNSAAVTTLDINMENPYSTYINSSSEQGDRPQLNTADIVISGGRGLGDAASFAQLTRIADQLHAAIGASRAAVDAGLAPNQLQVGQTGQIVAPKLYIAVGISGAIQHIAGMKDSQVIVAINKDPDAPIFQVADYGLVGDIKEILPQWETLLGSIEMNKEKKQC